MSPGAMETYIGTKIIRAQPMTREAYNQFWGWELPADEIDKAGEDGFLVEYPDGGQANTPHFDGYVSWSPAGVFKRSYSRCFGMNFGQALDAMRVGQKVARAGWNGKGMFLFLVPGSCFKVSRPPLLGIYEEGDVVDYHAHIDMKTAQGYVVPWPASQADMLADDWEIVQ